MIFCLLTLTRISKYHMILQSTSDGDPYTGNLPTRIFIITTDRLNTKENLPLAGTQHKVCCKNYRTQTSTCTVRIVYIILRVGSCSPPSGRAVCVQMFDGLWLAEAQPYHNFHVHIQLSIKMSGYGSKNWDGVKKKDRCTITWSSGLVSAAKMSK